MLLVRDSGLHEGEGGSIDTGASGSPYGFIGGPFLGTAAGDSPSKHVHSHIAMTYSALACLAILGDDFSRIREEKASILEGIKKLQLS